MQFSDLTIEGLARLEAKLLADVEVVRRMRALLEEHRAVWEGSGPGSAPALAVPVPASAAVATAPVAVPFAVGTRPHISLMETAEACLGSFPGETFTTDDLRRALRKQGANPRDSSMKTLMNQLLRSGKVVVHQLRKGRGGSLYRSTLPRTAPPESPSLPADAPAAPAMESGTGS